MATDALIRHLKQHNGLIMGAACQKYLYINITQKLTSNVWHDCRSS